MMFFLDVDVCVPFLIKRQLTNTNLGSNYPRLTIAQVSFWGDPLFLGLVSFGYSIHI